MMQMPDPFAIARHLSQSQNQDIFSNPRKMEMLKVLLSGDQKRGEELANNLLKSYGKTREEAMEIARQRFGGGNGFPQI